MHSTSTQIRPGILKVLIGALGVIVAGGAGGWILGGKIGYFAAAFTLLTASTSTYGVLGRKNWAKFGTWAGLVSGLGWGAAAGMIDGWAWSIAPVIVAGIGWFVSRAMHGYLKPAVDMPAEVLARVERLLVLSEEAVSGLRIGARSDGASIGIGYIPVEVSKGFTESRVATKFAADAKQAQDVLRKSAGVECAVIGVVPGTGIRERAANYTVVSADNLAWAVAEVQGPSREEIVNVAEANGITLSREQVRMVERKSGAGRKASGKKVVHQGRVTKVEK